MSELNPAPKYKKRGRSFTPTLISIAIAAITLTLIITFTATRHHTPNTNKPPRTLTVGLMLEPTSLDITVNSGVATSQILLDNLYQGLVGIKAGTISQIVPVLATELPTISEDGREYTFTLRQGVTFHSGAPLNADDVVSSLQQTLTQDNIGYTPNISRANDHTIIIKLDTPNSQLLWQLANYPGVIREQGAHNNLADTANGTGPYTLTKWKKGDSITLSKNKNYWGKQANLDTVIFRFLPEGRAAVNALKDADLDVHTALLPPLREEFTHSERYTLQRANSSDVFTLAYNCQKAPLNDQRVRQALSMAIDSQALITTQHGDGKPLGSPITELEPGYTNLTSVHPFDPKAAKALLKETGHPQLTLTVTVPNHYDLGALDLIKSQLSDIGVTLKISQVEFAVWLEKVYVNKDYELSYVDHAEARDFGNYANPEYYFGYNSSKVRSLYSKSLTTTNPQKENQLLQEAATQVAQDAPAKWLFNYTPSNVVSKHVSGFPTSNTNSRINLEGITLK